MSYDKRVGHRGPSAGAAGLWSPRSSALGAVYRQRDARLWEKAKSTIMADDRCVACMIKNIHHGPVGDLLAVAQEANTALRWMMRLAFCVHCIKTTFRKAKCTGPHGGDTSAQGVFRFTDDTWDQFGSGMSATWTTR